MSAKWGMLSFLSIVVQLGNGKFSKDCVDRKFRVFMVHGIARKLGILN